MAFACSRCSYSKAVFSNQEIFAAFMHILIYWLIGLYGQACLGFNICLILKYVIWSVYVC